MFYPWDIFSSLRWKMKVCAWNSLSAGREKDLGSSRQSQHWYCTCRLGSSQDSACLGYISPDSGGLCCFSLPLLPSLLSISTYLTDSLLASLPSPWSGLCRVQLCCLLITSPAMKNAGGFVLIPPLTSGAHRSPEIPPAHTPLKFKGAVKKGQYSVSERH